MNQPARLHPRAATDPADASIAPRLRYADDAIPVESVVSSVVLIGLMCFTVTLFSACFELLPVP